MALPLSPFFGVMGVSSSCVGHDQFDPAAPCGGNLDNKEARHRTTLYLPIHVDGALFDVGDSHGCQGDGEVCVTAIETALEGHFRLTVRDDMTLTVPRAETPTHLMTMGFDQDWTMPPQALREMISLIQGRTNLSKEHAYGLCSLACDLRRDPDRQRREGNSRHVEKSVLSGTLSKDRKRELRNEHRRTGCRDG